MPRCGRSRLEPSEQPKQHHRWWPRPINLEKPQWRRRIVETISAQKLAITKQIVEVPRPSSHQVSPPGLLSVLRRVTEIATPQAAALMMTVPTIAGQTKTSEKMNQPWTSILMT